MTGRRWLTLPTEVVCGGILPYLSVCDLQALDTAYTNKYLRPQLQEVWKSYHYDSFDAVLKDDHVAWLCGVDIRIISLTVNDAPELKSIVTKIPTLKKLHIVAYVRSTVLESLAANCPDLEELSANCVYLIDHGLSTLAQNCCQLHTLRMSSKELTDAGLSALARYGNQLHTLCIGDAKIADAGIQALCDNCPRLKHIELLRCPYLTDASLIAIANSYPLLWNIHLRYWNVTDDALIYFADKCHELRSVSFCSNNITNRGLTALWATNPNLMDVNICLNNFLSDCDVVQLVQCCPLLQKLNISECKHITDAAVIAVAEHCPQLRSINISSCYVSQVSDASLIALGQHCHELKSITISDLKNISDVGIAALAAGCPLLQEFHASDTNITDAGVISLTRGCHYLCEVNLQQCNSIGIAAVSAIAEKCPLVSELYLQNCKRVNDACLYVIAQHCRNITVLSISNTKVSDIAAVKLVIKSCRMLRSLN